MSFAPARVEQTGATTYNVSHGDDRGLFVEFMMEPVFQEFESNKEGRKIYKDVPHIHIVQPGGKSDIKRPVRLQTDGSVPPDNERFPRQWQAFQNQNEQVQHGTPLEQFPPLSKARVLEYKAGKVYTVEQLADMPDSILQTFGMDARRARDMAKAYLDNAHAGAALSDALAREEILRGELDALKKQFADFAAENPKRGPGRPRKDEAND